MKDNIIPFYTLFYVRALSVLIPLYIFLSFCCYRRVTCLKLQIREGILRIIFFNVGDDAQNLKESILFCYLGACQQDELCNFSAIHIFWKHAAWWDCSCKILTCATDVRFCLWVLGVFVSVESGAEGLTCAVKAAQVSPLWLHIALEAQGVTSNPPGFLYF